MGAGRQRRRCVRLFLAALFLLGCDWCEGARPETDLKEDAEMATAPLALEDLAGLTEFPITLSGETLETYLSKKPCLYFEWHFGVKIDGDWDWFSTGYHHETDLVIETPKGPVEVSWRKCRLFLNPSWTKTVAPGNASEAPEVVREKLAEEKKPITIEEYALLPGKTYFARLDTESYHLPPRPPDMKPQRRTNTVIWISDQPFRDGKPVSLITPTFKSWSY